MSRSLQINSDACSCYRCGTSYPSRKGYFPVSYSHLYKGVGYMPYCKKCVEDMYQGYLAICKEPSDAVRQMCRKLDLYWNKKIYDAACKTDNSRTIMSTYISKINSANQSGKSYDGTLDDEGTLWLWPTAYKTFANAFGEEQRIDICGDRCEEIEISEDIKSFWGPGYTNEMYMELEERLQYYKSQMPDVNGSDMNTNMLLRQIAMLEIDINKARADGKPVDKMTSSLTSLLSALQKPKKDDIDYTTTNTPFGVWIKKWEDERPIPEIDEKMKDVDGIVKYISVWFFGHLTHMLGIKNSYSKLYENEISRLRVERPEYAEDDEDSMLYNIFGDSDINES